MALLDATPPSILTALVAFSAVSTLGTLPPILVGLLTGVAMLVGGTGVSLSLSLSLQGEDRRFPLLRGTVDLLGLP